MEIQSAQNTNPEIWQVDVNGQIYETNLEEMAQWIAEGSLLPGDKVRRGNLRWLDANKVPLLYGFFNAKELGIESPKVSTTVSTPIQSNQTGEHPANSNFSPSPIIVNNEVNLQNLASPPTVNITNQNVSNQNTGATAAQISCCIHEDVEAKFACQTCLNSFCKECPNTYGTVRICPMCGAMCDPLQETIQKQQKQTQFQSATSEGFGFSDFGRALVYPFKYKISLFGGAILFMFFSFGSLGGTFMPVAFIFCCMLATMLIFGILSNTVENFSQGKVETNFMPSFDDFNLWDDVIHPFFLSIGACIVSFGPAAVVIALLLVFALSSTKPESDLSQVNQIKAITDKVKSTANQHNQQIESVENNQLNPDAPVAPNIEEQNSQDSGNQSNKAHKQGLESTIGTLAETREVDLNPFPKVLVAGGMPGLLLVGAAFLLGLFYFPAACAVAGYTQNFGSTVNPLIGLDTIKRLGVDYVKILAMGLLISIMWAFIIVFVKMIFSPFDLPEIGNLPAIAVGSLFTFYFWIVFSVSIGFALYKNSGKLNLYQ